AITMPLPVLLLLVLMIRGFFLEGFQEGIWFYFVPDFRTLLDPDVWVAALAQVFFSLSLGLGVMIAYGSFRKQKSPLVKMTYLTAISDTLIALISGFTVFATVGYMATKSGVPVGELAAQGPSLAFIVFPEILSVLPAPALFSFIFFIMLFTFAIDSLFSMVEAIAVVFKDWLPKSNQSIIVLFVCASCFICSTIFATQGGIYYLEIVDHFITRYLLIGGALCQVVAVAWVFGAERLMEEINGYSKWQVGRFWVFTLRYLCPAFLGILLLVALKEDLTKPFGGYSQPILFMYGWSIVCISLIVCSAASYFSYRQAINGKREIEGEGS
ncbi:MAG: sodium-dependent transporter, partial [Chlamydiia bacterium]|nr:sodium-dependent transporter [Chlamydiia bacterium]